MGAIKVWELEREYGNTPSCRPTLKTELWNHRIGVHDLWVGNGLIWSGERMANFVTYRALLIRLHA